MHSEMCISILNNKKSISYDTYSLYPSFVHTIATLPGFVTDHDAVHIRNYNAWSEWIDDGNYCFIVQANLA